MQVELLLSSVAFDDDRIDVEARRLLKELRHEVDAGARLPSGPPLPGAKGDVVWIGQIVVELVSSGAVTAFLGLLTAYVTMRPKLKIVVRKPDGSEIDLSAENVTDNAAAVALELKRYFP